MIRSLLWGVALLLVPAATAQPANVVTVTYSAGAKTAPVEIQSAPGQPVYRVWLEPQYDANNLLTNFELILRRPGDNPDVVRNRLDRSGNWHGYQVYYFAAEDFKDGVDKSQFGAERTVDVESTGEEVTITVLCVRAAPATAAGMSETAFKNLAVRVRIAKPR